MKTFTPPRRQGFWCNAIAGVSGRLRAGYLAMLLGAVVTPAHADEIIVSAASSMTDAMTEVARAYESAHPRTRVVLNFAASDTLVRQLRNGAPVDVLVTADSESMDRAARQQLLAAGSRIDIASNQLVLITPSGATQPPRQLQDLLHPRYRRLCWGDPASVPAGRYAVAALKREALDRRLAARVVLAQNVRQCLNYVARGEVDAGFVFATDARPGRVRIALPVASPLPIRYPAALAARSPNATAGRGFLAFLQSPAGRQLLSRHGFLPP